MVDATVTSGALQGHEAKPVAGPMLDADGTPLRVSLARSLRRQKISPITALRGSSPA